MQKSINVNIWFIFRSTIFLFYWAKMLKRVDFSLKTNVDMNAYVCISIVSSAFLEIYN